MGKGRLLGLAEGQGEGALGALAILSSSLDQGALLVQGGERLIQLFRAAENDQLVLSVQERQDLSVLLKLASERFNDFLQYLHDQ